MMPDLAHSALRHATLKPGMATAVQGQLPPEQALTWLIFRLTMDPFSAIERLASLNLHRQPAQLP